MARKHFVATVTAMLGTGCILAMAQCSSGGTRPGDGSGVAQTREAFGEGPAATCAPLPAGAVSWWRGKGDAVDVFNNNATTIHGNVGYAPGRGGFVFDGTSFVEASSRSMPTANADRTVELWARIDRPPPGRSEGFFAGYGALGSPEATFELGFVANTLGVDGSTPILSLGDSLPCLLKRGSPTSTELVHCRELVADPVLHGSWHHIAVTNEYMFPWLPTTDLGYLMLYVDAVPYWQGTRTITTAAATPFYIGRSGDPSQAFIGAVAEVTVYDRALSASEITSIHDAGAAGKCCPTGSTTCGGSCCGDGASCVGGACVCPFGETACGMRCVDLARDNDNCGTCGNTCVEGTACKIEESRIPACVSP